MNVQIFFPMIPCGVRVTSHNVAPFASLVSTFHAPLSSAAVSIQGCSCQPSSSLHDVFPSQLGFLSLGSPSSSPTLIYHPHLLVSSPTLIYHPHLPPSSTTLIYHPHLPPSFPTIICHHHLPPSSITLIYHPHLPP